MLLLGLVYAGNSLFGRRIRIAINFVASIVFFYVFGVIGELFGELFEAIPGISGSGFSGIAQNAVLAVVSLPIGTAALVVVLLFGKGGSHIRTTLAARRTAMPVEPPA